MRVVGREEEGKMEKCKSISAFACVGACVWVAKCVI